MEHTQIVDAIELEGYADARGSEAVIPELVWMLVNEVSDLTVCRIPYGDAINQPGWDGLVETENGFRQFTPKKKSFWEISTGISPQDQATENFTKRTDKMSLVERQDSTFVFVTPRGAGSGGWNEPAQSNWIEARKNSGWKAIKILDGVQLADWLREYPAIGKWLLKKTGLVKNIAGFTTPTEHWENLSQLNRPGDPALPAKVFTVGREKACAALEGLFRRETVQLVLAVESEHDAEDFVAAFLASLDADIRRSYSNRCLLVKDAETWLAMANVKTAHVLVAHPNLDLESSGEQLHMATNKNHHAVIIPVSGVWKNGSDTLTPLRSPSASILEAVLTGAGYQLDRARELAGAGALSLAGLKRHLRGLSELPPYATWENARELARAGLLGRWAGENPADKAAVEALVGNGYGEWIELVRPETLRSDTPLTQRNENWKVISRGEAWSALGVQLNNDDLDRFRKVALVVLGERNPKLQLPPEERFAAIIHGKVLQHSSSLRQGIAETLALLGSKPGALSSCSQGKAETIALLVVRELLKDADWITWASLNSDLPLLAEAAPDEFLDAVETSLLDLAKSPFNEIFAQERSGITGQNYMTGLLWALETLAWEPNYFVRVIVLLGELASIDPGGNWSNRPANSIVDILLPWHPQTCATISKRKTAMESLLREQPDVCWKVLMALLPNTHSATTGSHKPAWRGFIQPGWSEGVTNREYWDQVVVYAELATSVAAADLTKLAELIDRLPDLPNPAHTQVLEHLASDKVVGLPEADRQPLWDALVDLAAKHRKYADAPWVMPSTIIAKIEETATKLAPTSASLIHRRLFSGREYDLFEEKGDYEEQRKKLELRRQDAVREILNAGQITGLLNFVKLVSSPTTVGHSLGIVGADSIDAILLPEYLDKPEKEWRAFISGFVWSRFVNKGWPWVDAVITNAWTAEQKAVFLALLPFVQGAWQRAESLLGDNVPAYWKIVNTNGAPKEHLLEAIDKLIVHGRPRAAVVCLNWLLFQKAPFPADLVARALFGSLRQTTEPLDHYAVKELIEWLQENESTDTTALFQIEWAYLPLLDHQYGGVPKTLEKRMANDPAFFCEVLSIVFRSDKVERKVEQPTEDEKSMAQNAYRLLDGWKTVPGRNLDGSFDAAIFTSWLTKVKELATESGHLRTAMSQIGAVLPYAPKDPNGLWIHHSVAEALNAKDAAGMRSGFTCEIFNMRGMHGFTSGQAERELAALNREKADALENKGYSRFATAMREFASSYERAADHEATRNPFEE